MDFRSISRSNDRSDQFTQAGALYSLQIKTLEKINKIQKKRSNRTLNRWGCRRAYIEVVLGVVEGEVEGHVGVVDVDVDELDDVLVRDLPQELRRPTQIQSNKIVRYLRKREISDEEGN